MLKKLASQTVIYGGTNILSKGINFVLVPLHTGVFAVPDDYGIVSYFYAYAAFFNVVYTYGMETTYFRFTGFNKTEGQHYADNATTSLLLSSLLFSGTLLIFSSEIAATLGFANGMQYVQWFALLLAIDAIVSIPFAQLRQENRPIKFGTIKVLNVVANVGLNAFFLIVCRDIYKGEYLNGLQGVVQSFYNPELGLGYAFLSNLLANALLIPLLWSSFRKWRPQLHWLTLKPMYLYAYPLLFTGLAGATNEVLDRILIVAWLPDDFYATLSPEGAMGVYSACYKLSIFIVLAVQGFRYAAEPFFFAKAKDKNSPEVFASVMKFFIITCVFMFLGVMANLHWISHLFLQTDVYREGLNILPFLFTAHIFLGIFYNLSVWYKVLDKTYIGAAIAVAGALLTVILNYWLIPLFGYTGSALATLLCYASMSLASYTIGRRFWQIPYTLFSNTFYIFSGIALAFLMLYYQPESLFNELLIKNAVIVIYLVVVLLVEKKNLSEALRL